MRSLLFKNRQHKASGTSIADTAKASIYNLASVPLTTVQNCDILVLGTPVEGAIPAKETVAFVESMVNVQDKKAILFCTYKAFGNERTMKKIEKMLEPKGFKTILKVSKKGMKPKEETDFSDIQSEVKKTLEKQ